MIKISNVCFSYTNNLDQLVLKNINVIFEKGKYYAILGHNGSGKSTFSKILSGIFKPQKGTIEVDSILLNKENLPKIRKKIGIIFQNPDNQFVGATVEDDIAFSLENINEDPKKMRQIIIDLAEKVQMQSYLDREPQFLSGGQKQRVAIASVLALNPQIIIFDEITSMLDPRGKADVIKILDNLRNDKEKTLISITHNMNEAILADEVIVFANGEIIAQGDPKLILNDKNIIKKAKIDSPFFYKISEGINLINPTYNQDELLDQLWKLKHMKL
ncbi:energy-coupling factor transporter ATPase [Mycoplasma flocculare]|uniref:Energy-coupling factor transporter ATPase n=1 Tax=Mesomycoplasma flocculare TaxID=2128 RepID=A0AAW9XA69_MESFC|nr:energy-coupling factor transporter ATPase [Mesomycoplasma flocculare]MXR39551.1 energy-coupling factor transporter ATPase [Mycoplasma sp. MF12]MXR06148.1 energy-coupling factor transporter ATPase [Mesomycoplasma flocculare]MXR12371.1 energy-coupling factor transporter ATPase [Mesomycoplasma flocculare]MXR13598.1 energy-coupling factor transporter ATPase [Mesomycoplasma flocculare]MXR22995.1 energy-coupling factor transporter ATPase [Mesomycoplasma flocculare]